MKKKVWIWGIVIVVVLALAVTTAMFIKGKQTKEAGNEIEMGITVQKAAEQELSETILVTGKIVPESEQKVYLEPEKGEIIEYKVEENQLVKVGDPLFLYDSSKIEVELKRATREKDLIQSRGKTEQSQIAELDKQIVEMKKKVGIQIENAEGEEEIPVTQNDVNQLVNEKVQVEIQYESTKSEIESVQERITDINARKKDMIIVSKINGIIVKVNKNVAKTETGANEAVIHIISSDPYKVIGTMSEFDAVKIQKNQAVLVRPKVFKEREWKGVIESVSQFPNEESGGGENFGGGGGGNVTMYPFKVAITDDTTELRQGFHVSLEIKIGGAGKPLAVPHSAIIVEDGIDIIYILVDGKLAKREIKKGKMNDEFIEITEGLVLGDLVVITPNNEMHDGMEVTSFDEVE